MNGYKNEWFKKTPKAKKEGLQGWNEDSKKEKTNPLKEMMVS